LKKKGFLDDHILLCCLRRSVGATETTPTNQARSNRSLYKAKRPDGCTPLQFQGDGRPTGRPTLVLLAIRNPAGTPKRFVGPFRFFSKQPRRRTESRLRYMLLTSLLLELWLRTRFAPHSQCEISLHERNSGSLETRLATIH
jgi:hypothetical protein